MFTRMCFDEFFSSFFCNLICSLKISIADRVMRSSWNPIYRCVLILGKFFWLFFTSHWIYNIGITLCLWGWKWLGGVTVGSDETYYSVYSPEHDGSSWGYIINRRLVMKHVHLHIPHYLRLQARPHVEAYYSFKWSMYPVVFLYILITDSLEIPL